MNEDMSDIIQKMNDMLKNNQIPDSIKNIMNNISQENSVKNDLSSSSIPDNTTDASNSNNNFNDFSGFDIDTMLKMKSIIDSINANQNDPRSTLLNSLKPYLKPSRKEKVDQYIKLFNMGKIIEIINPLGGEKKNDV